MITEFIPISANRRQDGRGFDYKWDSGNRYLDRNEAVRSCPVFGNWLIGELIDNKLYRLTWAVYDPPLSHTTGNLRTTAHAAEALRLELHPSIANLPKRPLLPIPVSAAKLIAKNYGYDQVVIIARRVGSDPEPHGEHVTTYGVDKANCTVAAHIGEYVTVELMKWEKK